MGELLFSANIHYFNKTKMFHSWLDKQPVIPRVLWRWFQRANGKFQVGRDGGNIPQQRAQEVTLGTV